jgi:hypothetical protein
MARAITADAWAHLSRNDVVGVLGSTRPSRVGRGALAPAAGRHPSLTGEGSTGPLRTARAPSAAREGACAPHSNCIVTAEFHAGMAAQAVRPSLVGAGEDARRHHRAASLQDTEGVLLKSTYKGASLRARRQRPSAAKVSLVFDRVPARAERRALPFYALLVLGNTPLRCAPSNSHYSQRGRAIALRWPRQRPAGGWSVAGARLRR